MGLFSVFARECQDNDGYRAEACQSHNGSAMVGFQPYRFATTRILGLTSILRELKFIHEHLRFFRFRQRVERENIKDVGLLASINPQKKILNRSVQIQSFSNTDSLHLLHFEIIFKSVVVFEEGKRETSNFPG